MKKALFLGAAALAACLVALYQTRQAAHLRDEVQTLRQQQATQAEQLQQLQRERDTAIRQLAALRDDNTRPNPDLSELLKLRGEVGALRNENNRLRQDSPSGSPAASGLSDDTITRSKFSVSYDTAVWNIFGSSPQSMTWELRTNSSGSVQVTVASSPDQKDREKYKQELIFNQGFRGDPAEFVGERMETMAGREWTVLEFRNAHRHPTPSEIHYFLPTDDGYVTVFVYGEEARLPGLREPLDAFLHQIRVK